MDPEDAKVEKTRNGGLKIFVQDDSTDTLVVFDVYHLKGYIPQHICAATVIRGNYSGSTRYGCRPDKVRRPVRANVHIQAEPVTPEELERRKAQARQLAEREKQAAARRIMEDDER
jgi:hypothetical protein